MKRNLKDDGTWSAVVYWLRRRGVYSRRSALRSHDLTTIRLYREHSWACLEAAARLEVKILEVAFAEEIDRADNKELSAQSSPTAKSSQYHSLFDFDLDYRRRSSKLNRRRKSND